MIETTTRAMVEEAKRQTDEQYDRVREEAQRYKQQKLAQIDQEVADLVTKLTKKILGQAIEPAKQEELIIKALQRAREEGVF